MTRTQQLLADDPLWLILLKVVVLFGIGVVPTLVLINAERKVVGRDAAASRPQPGGPGGWCRASPTGSSWRSMETSCR